VHRELVTLLRVILTIARSDSLNVDAHCAKRIDEQLMPLARSNTYCCSKSPPGRRTPHRLKTRAGD
jgi:hypothetical protein